MVNIDEGNPKAICFKCTIGQGQDIKREKHTLPDVCSKLQVIWPKKPIQ